MPIYEYRCATCGEELDHFHRSFSEPAPPCPTCGADALERKVSRTSFQLKGSGWYVTDYAAAKGDKKTKDADKGDQAAASDSKTDDSKTSDSKASETSDSKVSDSKASDSKASDSKASDSKASASPGPSAA